jgi:methionyl-tRNA synthetase
MSRTDLGFFTLLQIQETADKHNISVQKWCDDISQCFKALYSKAGIQYDDYVRTTEDRHKKAVDKLWNILIVCI